MKLEREKLRPDVGRSVYLFFLCNGLTQGPSARGGGSLQFPGPQFSQFRKQGRINLQTVVNIEHIWEEYSATVHSVPI